MSSGASHATRGTNTPIAASAPSAARVRRGRRVVPATTSGANRKPKSAKPAAREAGTAAAFQMPPSPASVPSVPVNASARGANAVADAAACMPAPGWSRPGTSHGRQSRVPMPKVTTRLPLTVIMPVARAKSPPVGVIAAPHMQSQAVRCLSATAMAGSSHAATASDHWPCRSRSTTKGLMTARTIAAQVPTGVWPNR